MTVIAAVVDKGSVYMGGDSAGVAGLSISIRSDEKVFHNGPFLIGFTSSYRMGQILRYKYQPPKQVYGQDDMSYMCTDFIDSLRGCYAGNGFGKIPDRDNNEGGTFLVGYNGVLYMVAGDFQVGIPAVQYDAVGCSADIALGALHATKGKKPEDRVKASLEAAATFSAGVAGPFTILKQDKPKK
jgi:hypothetical protein